LKIYQIKYRHFGTLKYCYTDNFIDFYANYPEVETKQNRLLFKKEFYEKVQQVQTELGLGQIQKGQAKR
jgi:hypothetical protein